MDMQPQQRKPFLDAADYVIFLGSVPFQSLPISAAAVVFVIARHWSLTARGFVSITGVTPFWCKVFPGAAGLVEEMEMSREEEEEEDEPVVAPPLQPPSATPEEPRNVIAVDDNERNALLFAGKADALAAMVHAGKVKETEGIKIVYGVGASSTNKTYQVAREMLKARLARLAPEKYADLSPEQEALRAGLGLHNAKRG